MADLRSWAFVQTPSSLGPNNNFAFWEWSKPSFSSLSKHRWPIEMFKSLLSNRRWTTLSAPSCKASSFLCSVGILILGCWPTRGRAYTSWSSRVSSPCYWILPNKCCPPPPSQQQYGRLRSMLVSHILLSQFLGEKLHRLKIKIWKVAFRRGSLAQMGASGALTLDQVMVVQKRLHFKCRNRGVDQ